MPRKHRNRRRTLKGGWGWSDMTGDGWFGSSSSSGSNSGSWFNSFWSDKPKTEPTAEYSPQPQYTPPPQYTSPPEQPNYETSGGKTRRKRMRGGFSSNTPTSGLAYTAASFSGNTAKPHGLIGGKSGSHKRKRNKTRRRSKRH